jgi:hypothetical protein
MGTAGNDAPFMDQSDAALAGDEDRVRDRDRLVLERTVIEAPRGLVASIRDRIDRIGRALRRR